MKRSSAIGILFLLSIHLVGFYAYFIVRQAEIHREMKEQLATLPSEKLTVISVPGDEVKASWLDDMEFEFEGKMYDIARIEREGGTAKIYCYHDLAEDNLLSFLDEVTRSASQDERPVPSTILHFLTLEFVPVSITYSNFVGSHHRPATHYFVHYTSPARTHHAPPPRG